MDILTNEDLQLIKGGIWIYSVEEDQWIWISEDGSLPGTPPPTTIKTIDK